MFNRSVYFSGNTTTNTNIKVNAVSGGIVKNHKDSFFLRFNLKSALSERLLSENPHRGTKPNRDKRYSSDPSTLPDKFVEVLQLVIVGDMEVIAEVIDLPLADTAKKGIE